MLIRQKYHVKYANFYVASAVTKCSLRVDGFTGNLDDAVKEYLMLIKTLILKTCGFLICAGW